MINHAHSFPTDPLLPTTVNVFRVVVSSTPAPPRLVPAQHSYRYASVEAQVVPCTFGDMIKVTLALSRTYLKGWSSETTSLEWHPYRDYSHLVSDTDLNKVMEMIETWPVLYKKI